MKLPHRPLIVASVMVLLTVSGVVYLGKAPQGAHPDSARISSPDARQAHAAANQSANSEGATAKRRLTEQEAINLALNELRSSPEDSDKLLLDNPKHHAEFSSEKGISFSPRFVDMTWEWRLQHFGSESRNAVADPKNKPVPQNNKEIVDFDYGAFVERYIPKEDTVEQQFVLRKRPDALEDGEDLVVRGQVTSEGSFQAAHTKLGWNWRDEASGRVVSLGQVTVFDADGDILPATMLASADTTQITVDGASLSTASYPVTIDPEIGTNDFLISTPGLQQDDHVHELPTVAYGDGKYCVAWIKGNHRPAALFELRVQLVDTADATTSATGPQLKGDPLVLTRKAVNTRPAVSYNGRNFLIVWNEAKDDAFTTLGKAQAINQDGELVSENPYEVTSSMPHEGNSLTLSSDPNLRREFVLAWIDQKRSVYRRVLNPAGGTVRDDRSIGGHGNIRNASELMLSSTYVDGGGHCVTWMQSDVETGERSIVARFVGNNGAVDPKVAFVAFGSNDMTSLDVTANDHPSLKDLAFVWQDENKIYHRLMDRFLNEKTEPKVVSVEENDSAITNVQIAHSGEADAYAVSWAAHSNGDLGIRSSLVAEATGNVIQGGFDLTDVGADCAIAMSPQEGNDRLFAVVSMVGEPRADDLDKPMLGYTLEMPNNAFEIVSDPPLVFDFATGTELMASSPSATRTGLSDQYLVVWEQELTAPGDWEIMMRYVSGDPDVQNTTGTFVVSYDERFEDPHTLENNRYPSVTSVQDQNEFVVVWQATPQDVEGPLNEEVYARTWRGRSGGWTGEPFRVSETGVTSETAGGFAATKPDVVFNTTDRKYLVVWSANGETNTQVPVNPEIYARHLRTSGGVLDGIRGLSNSAAGQLPAVDPAVAYNSTDNQYMVVWSGSKGDPFTMALEEEEIIGQMLNGNGDPIGFPELRVSQMGPILNTRYGARTPDVAYNPDANEFLVVWAGENDFFQNTEIHGQYVRGNGTRRDFPHQISDMGILDDFAGLWVPMSPSLTYEAANNTFQVVWTSGHVLEGTSNGETEVFITEVREDGSRGGQHRISDLGPDGNDDYDANNAAIATNGDGTYLVVFDGNDDQAPLTQASNAIFGQHYDHNGVVDNDTGTDGPGKDNGGPDKDIPGSGDSGTDKPGTDEPGSGTDSPQPLRVETDGNGVWLVWEAKQDACFAIEASTDLQNWDTIAERDVVAGEAPAAAPEKFYRLRIISNKEEK